MNAQAANHAPAIRIAISGWYGHRNLGDDAILRVLVTELGRRLGCCSFAVLTDSAEGVRMEPPPGCRIESVPHPPLYRLSHARYPSVWVQSVLAWRRLVHADLFVLGGGGLLRDNFPRSNLLRLLDEVLLARLAGVPVALFAIGAGPFITRIGRRLIRSAVHLARSVTVRDRASAAALRDIGAPPSRIRTEADPALLLATAVPPCCPASGGGPNIGICPSRGMLTGFAGGAPGNPRLVETLADVALRLVERPGARVWLIPFCRSSTGDDDVALCEEIWTAANRHASIRVAPWIADPEQAKGLLARMDLIIGARLHSLIFGIGAGVPCVAINYEPKVAGFMADMGLSDYCLDPLAFTPERAIEVVRRLLVEWPSAAPAIGKRAASAQDRVRRALDRLAQLALSHARVHRGRGAPSFRPVPARFASSPHPSAPEGSVSVIIPAYNAEGFIADAIDSVLGQTLPPYEIIVVDDGSTDGTLDVVRRYGDRIRLLRQPNRGPAAARNLGLANARGEFVAFLDADDLWTPRNLELQVRRIAEDRRHVLSYGRVRPFVGEPPPAFRRTEPTGDAWPEGDVETSLIHDTIWATCAVVARRDVLSRLGGFDEGLRIGEDYDLWLRCAAAGSVRYTPYYVAAIRQHAASTTRTSPYRTVPPPVRVIRRHLRRRPHLRRRIGDDIVRRRLARWYLESSLHSLDTNRLAPSFLHFALAGCLAPSNWRAVRLYGMSLARSLLKFTIGWLPRADRRSPLRPEPLAPEAAP